MYVYAGYTRNCICTYVRDTLVEFISHQFVQIMRNNKFMFYGKNFFSQKLWLTCTSYISLLVILMLTLSMA